MPDLQQPRRPCLSLLQGLAVVKLQQLTMRHRRPGLIVGEWLGGDHGDPIIGARGIAEIDGDVLIHEVRRLEGCLTHDVMQARRATGE